MNSKKQIKRTASKHPIKAAARNIKPQRHEDFLDEIVRERTATNPNFPNLVKG